MFFEITRIASVWHPKALLLENVSNLYHHGDTSFPSLLLIQVDQGHTLAVIVAALEAIGYAVHHRIVNSRIVLPQQRERVYFVAFRRDMLVSGSDGVSVSPHEIFQWPDFNPSLATVILFS